MEQLERKVKSVCGDDAPVRKEDFQLWRKRVLRSIHPDKGGSTEKFVKVKRLFDAHDKDAKRRKLTEDEIREDVQKIKEREEKMMRFIVGRCVKEYKCGKFTICARPSNKGHTTYFVRVNVRYDKNTTWLTVSSGWISLTQLFDVMLKHELDFKVCMSVIRKGLNMATNRIADK